MTDPKKTSSKLGDSISNQTKYIAALATLVLGFVAYFSLKSSGVVAQYAALLVGVALAVALFFWTDKARPFLDFWRDSWRELQKVVWPTRAEAIQMTLFVFVFVLVMAIALWATDKTIEWVLFDLILGWK